MKKFKVTVTLKSGIVRTHRIKSTPENVDKVLKMIDDGWQSVGKVDGYVSFGGNYYRISEIAHYSLKKRFF